MANCSLTPDFEYYSKILDKNYDIRESIIKTTRDLTRESKKIIGMLHRLAGVKGEQYASGLESCEKELLKVRNNWISCISTIVQETANFLYYPNYCGGMEEYVEALLFCSFLLRGSLMTYEEVLQFIILIPTASETNPDVGFEMNYHIDPILLDTIVSCSIEENYTNLPDNNDDQRTRVVSFADEVNVKKMSNIMSGDLMLNTKDKTAKTPDFAIMNQSEWRWPGDRRQLHTTVTELGDQWARRIQLMPYSTYILGLSDVSGELMRYCIKSMTLGLVSDSEHIMRCLRSMSRGYLALRNSSNKYLLNKISVHERNLLKVEAVHYNFSLRRCELSPQQLQTYFARINDDDDDEDGV